MVILITERKKLSTYFARGEERHFVMTIDKEAMPLGIGLGNMMFRPVAKYSEDLPHKGSDTFIWRENQ